jgi:NAD(P)-dependent dehydrogenase (short-subunit alcohol dehydrogenase family)
MKILVIGASGMIGRILLPELQKKHEVITAGRSSGDVRVDISSFASIENLFKEVKELDAVVCVAGTTFSGPIQNVTGEHLISGIQNKVLGQTGLVIVGQHYLNDGGSFTLTSGKLGEQPAPQNAVKALANGALNSFVVAAAMDLDRGIRINAVSPGQVSIIPPQEVLNAYLHSIEGTTSGEVIKLGY